MKSFYDLCCIFKKPIYVLQCILVLMLKMVFFCAGLLILTGGIMVILDMNGIIESPIGYENGVYTATIYTVVGLIWSIATGIGLFRSFKKIFNSKNRNA